MGPSASFIFIMTLFFYIALVTPLCVKVGSSTSRKLGWSLAVGLILPPLGLYVAFLVQ